MLKYWHRYLVPTYPCISIYRMCHSSHYHNVINTYVFFSIIFIGMEEWNFAHMTGKPTASWFIGHALNGHTWTWNPNAVSWIDIFLFLNENTYFLSVSLCGFCSCVEYCDCLRLHKRKRAFTLYIYGCATKWRGAFSSCG